ncbi:nucleotidyltransferase domain-containing protein [Mariniphaga sediminis]|jgi:predicted nucleotidyltransferase|uniref:Nucleotidyltransferase domain-containing protein n=1 Tax=Mariniphaga sediminis TaxID=1628158 RepID=A0A399CUI2_9BACT|nr:nucleotidyltransferase domain-containing protein [Mariniphaga sediminis]RIH62956.1 nucleotidyltransferase domain-containing protein [Mariniphaga sediminis]
MNNIISSNIEKIRLFFEMHKIERAFIFGSAVTGEFNEESDLDFLVRFQPDLDPLEKGELWWNLHDKLRDFFNREIDIVTENSLKNPYFIEELNETKELIYEKQD